jgi:hypothetical protein
MHEMPPLKEAQEEMLDKISLAMDSLTRMEKAVFNEDYLIAYSNLGALFDSAFELQYLIEHEFSIQAMKLYQDEK